jgi:hypothetical protein
MKKTLIGLTLITLFLLATGMILFHGVLKEHYFTFFPFLILILYLVNAGFFYFFHLSLHKPANIFIRRFMASTGIKLVIYLILILSYILTTVQTAVPFAVTLAISYLFYTAYDLVIMLSLVKQYK